MPRKRSNTPRFDAAWQDRRRRKRLWLRWRWLVLLLLLLAASWAIRVFDIGSGPWEPVARSWSECFQGSGAACVIDGDTVMIADRRIRLTGFDAPERDGACEAERLLAAQARAELTRWLNLGEFEWDGGAEPPRDRYGRKLRAARRGPEELADFMVEQGLARRSGFTREWCAAGA